MEEKDKWKLLSIVLIFFFVSSIVIISDLNSRINDYSKETDLVTNEFTSLGLGTPQWNTTTRYFEVWDESTAYVGYTRFNDMETNLLEIVEFEDCEVIKLSGRYQYTADDSNITVITSREVQRRFY